MSTTTSSERAIAVAQTTPSAGDVEANVAQHLDLARLAASDGARVVLFPELSLTGYELSVAAALAFVPGDARLKPLQEVSRALSLVVIAGAPVRLNERLHLGALVLAPDGSCNIYTKRRLGAFGASALVDGSLPPAERTVFEPADHDPLVVVNRDVAAIAICADVGDPSHPRRAAERGARSYLASMFVIRSEFDEDAERARKYAGQHSFCVALANYGARTGGLAAAGRSSIWSEQGELLCRLPDTGAGVAVALQKEGRWTTTIRRPS